MKVVVLQENLKAGLSKVAHAVAGKSTLPVLSNVLLSTDGGRLKLAATNLEIGIPCHIGAKVEDEGAVTIPARLFADVVSGLPNEPVTLTLDERTQTVRIECGRVEASIKGIEAEEFPVLPTFENGNLLVLTPADVKVIATRVAVAAATDDTRPVLAAVLMRVAGKAATAAAADGFRLAVQKWEIADEGKHGDYLIPARALTELARLAASSDENILVSVAASGGLVAFTGNGWQMFTRLIDGKFPDFERILPAAHTTHITLNGKQFANAIKLASYFAADAANIVRLETGTDTMGVPVVTICANAAEVGDNKNMVDATITSDKDASAMIALNVKYLAQAIGACGDGEMSIRLNTPQSPVVIGQVGDDTYTHLVMPMTIRP